MAKPTKKSDADDDDRDADVPKKKKKDKDKKGGGNTTMYLLIGGGVLLLACCTCGGVGGGGGYYLGWFGGEKKIAKATDKTGTDPGKTGGTPNGSDKSRGTGPLVTRDNFQKAARDFTTFAKVEQLLGPGLPLKGADLDEQAEKYQSLKAIRGFAPANTDFYKWWNDQDVYFISFSGGQYMGHASEPIAGKGGKAKDKGTKAKGGK